MKTLLVPLALLALTPAAVSAQPAALPTAAIPLTTDKDVFGYYLGIPIFLRALAPPFLGGKGPAAPSKKVPDLIVYITAPTSSDKNFHAPPAMIPTPQGKKYLPPHEDTLTRFVTAAEPADALGYFVVAGPEASPDRVRVAIDPRQPDVTTYVSSAGLAEAIMVGNQWLPLNNHLVIEYGLRIKLLALRYFDYGGLMWADWHDEDVGALAGKASSPYPAPLPPQR